MSDTFEESSNIMLGLEESHTKREPLSRNDCLKNCLSGAVIGTIGYLSYRYSHIPILEVSEAANGISSGPEEGMSAIETAKAGAETLVQLGLIGTKLCTELGGLLVAAGGVLNVGTWGLMAAVTDNNPGR